MRAIELKGRIDEQRRLHLDEGLPMAGPSEVRVIILVPENDDISEDEWLRAAATNASFASLSDPGEDIYTIDDGQPFRDEG